MARDGKEKAARVLGLTGPIACGKSTVGDYLLELGALDRIDADRVVHELMASGTPTSRRIAAAFGRDILARDGGVDRRALGDLVFPDPEALRRLESIVHPEVRLAIRAKLEQSAGRRGVIVVDAVKLLGSELAGLCDEIWLVQCRRETQLDRLMKIRGLRPEAAEARLAAQPSYDSSAVHAVIENAGSREALRAQVERLWAAMTERFELENPQQ